MQANAKFVQSLSKLNFLAATFWAANCVRAGSFADVKLHSLVEPAVGSPVGKTPK